MGMEGARLLDVGFFGTGCGGAIYLFCIDFVKEIERNEKEEN